MNRAIKQLGELALRVDDLPSMTAFYRDVVGLEMFSDQSPGFVFFKTGEGVEGHPQIFGMFDRTSQPAQDHSTLDHFAFVIDLADYDAEKQRLEGLGVSIFTTTFPVFHWRALFFTDPEGNTIEFVCYDARV